MPAISRLIISGVDFRLVKPQQLHAVACTLLDDDLTHWESRKQWAIGPLRGDETVGLSVLTVRSLSDQVEDRLRTTARQGVRLVFGEQEGVLIEPPEQLRSSDWETLATPSPHPPRDWDLECLSPTALSTGQRYTPLIVPPSLIRSLSKRWESLRGRGEEGRRDWLPRLTDEQLTQVWVSALAGDTITETIPHFSHKTVADKVFPGFVGRMTIRCDDPVIASAVDCYLRFAEYAGVGALTTHGFGTVRVRASRTTA